LFLNVCDSCETFDSVELGVDSCGGVKDERHKVVT